MPSKTRATTRISAMALAATLAIVGSARASSYLVCLHSGSIHALRCCDSSEESTRAPKIARACCEARLIKLDPIPGSSAQRQDDLVQAPAVVASLALPESPPRPRELAARPEPRTAGPPLILLTRALLL